MFATLQRLRQERESAAINSTRPRLLQLSNGVMGSVVAIKTFFPGTGFCVRPGMIVTSAHVVGFLSPIDDGSGFYRCSMGRSFALTREDVVLETEALLVTLAGDIAILRVHADLVPVDLQRYRLFEPSVLITKYEAEGENKQRLVLKEYREVRNEVGTFYGPTVTDCYRTQWPYTDPGWARIGHLQEAQNEVSILAGSPFFKHNGNVVGFISYVMGDEAEPNTRLKDFVVPAANIQAFLEILDGRGPLDPTVYDFWVTHTSLPAPFVPDHNIYLTSEFS